MSLSEGHGTGDISEGEGTVRRLLEIVVDATWIAFSVIIVVVVIGLLLGFGEL